MEIIKCQKRPHKDIRGKLYSILEMLTFEPYDLDFLASSCGMTRRSFNRFFRKNFSMTPVEYIRIQRLNFAANALSSTSATIKEIAGKYAYASQSYFCRDFKCHFGISPVKYRKKKQKSARS